MYKLHVYRHKATVEMLIFVGEIPKKETGKTAPYFASTCGREGKGRKKKV